MPTKTANRKCFTARMKMADVIDSDSRLLAVVPRMGMGFGFGEESVEEVCRRYGVSTGAFLAICRVYAYGDAGTLAQSLQEEDIRDIVAYLRRSHTHYGEVVARRLTISLEKLMESCDQRCRQIISKFFGEYMEELRRHFTYEDKVVFPYVESVLSHTGKADYNILQYEENHSNVDEKLADLKNILMKYLPRECGTGPVAEVLDIIFLLQDDLRRHTVIEDDILVPLVNRIENHEK